MSTIDDQLPVRRAGGRFDRVARAKFLEYLEQGASRQAAARRIGFTIRTINERLKSDDEFAEAVMAAEGEVFGQIQEALIEKARKGHVEAAKFVLERRVPEMWGPLSARSAVAAAAQLELTDEEVKGEVMIHLETILKRERALREHAATEARVIDAESVEVLPPAPPDMEALAEVDWEAELDK